MLDRPPIRPPSSRKKVSAGRTSFRRADRQRRWRQRCARGVLCVTVELTGDVLDLLCRTYWLDPRDADSKPAIAAALSDLLASMAKHT